MPAVNALFLGTLLYQSRLVPRGLPILGLIGAVLLVASDVGVIVGLWGQFSTIPALTTLPIAIWEFWLGVYLTVKGFSRLPSRSWMQASPNLTEST
jgi:peptidoglycan/LPS O-acetylase OafA/YrhL